jgi:hypothetical protein
LGLGLQFPTFASAGTGHRRAPAEADQTWQRHSGSDGPIQQCQLQGRRAKGWPGRQSPHAA